MKNLKLEVVFILSGEATRQIVRAEELHSLDHSQLSASDVEEKRSLSVAIASLATYHFFEAVQQAREASS